MTGTVTHDDIAVDDARTRQDTAGGHRDGAGKFAVDRQVALVDEGAAADLAVAGQRNAAGAHLAQGAGTDDIAFKGQGIALGTRVAPAVKTKLPTGEIDIRLRNKRPVETAGP